MTTAQLDSLVTLLRSRPGPEPPDVAEVRAAEALGGHTDRTGRLGRQPVSRGENDGGGGEEKGNQRRTPWSCIMRQAIINGTDGREGLNCTYRASDATTYTSDA